MNSRHIMAPKLRFPRGLKAKVPGAVTACVPGLLRRRSSKFLQARRPRLAQEATMGKVTIFFFTFKGLSNVWLLFYQRSDTALLLGISPDSWLAMFHSQRCSYVRTDDPSTKAVARRAFTVSWNVEVFVHSRSVVIFPPGAPVTSFLSQQISTVIRSPRFQQDETSSLLDRRRNESHQTYSSYQLVASGNIHNAVSRHLDKNRAKHRRTVFSMKKAQKSKQRSTNWRRRHLGDMQQQPRRWPGIDKCVETKLRWDVYIRPWPPGWSFWRRIYTSRGSERVKVPQTRGCCVPSEKGGRKRTVSAQCEVRLKMAAAEPAWGKPNHRKSYAMLCGWATWSSFFRLLRGSGSFGSAVTNISGSTGYLTSETN